MAKKKIAIIGHFGENHQILDGQTIKTRILCNELSNAVNWEIRKVDTYYRREKPIKLAVDSIKALATTKDILVLLSGNGMRFYFPVLYAATKLLHVNIYHDVIGSNLAEYVRRYPAFRRYLNSFCVNWVETKHIKTQLEQIGVRNAEVLPNFKRLNILPEEKINTSFTKPYRFCTFSRVTKEKGIEDAIKAIEEINKCVGCTLCQLDIYGRIDSSYAQQFYQILEKATQAVRYCGEIPFDKSVEIISDYYAMLFPTFWVGEGFAGSIIDAFSAGLPVIATDWNCNAEIIQNGINGIIYPNEHLTTLEDSIIWAIEHTDAIVNMKKVCIQQAHDYQPDRFIKIILDRIGKQMSGG